MLVEKDRVGSPLAIVKKSAVRVIRMHPALKKHSPFHKSSPRKLPPLNSFNSGYLKGRDHDPL